jgi:phosphoribosylformylglycinamidine synthase
VTLEPTAAGDLVYLLGRTRDETGGSEYHRWLGERDGRRARPGAPRPCVGNRVPRLDPERTLPLYRALAAATAAGLVRSAATPGLGGLAVALARCVMAAELGLELDLGAGTDLAELPAAVALFSESLGRFVVTVAPHDAERFEERFAELPCRRVGRVTAQARLCLRLAGPATVDLDVSRLAAAFKGTLADD